MATLPGLHKRGGIYQLRVVIPLDLRQHFGRAKIVQSLQTSCNREAKLAGAQLRASLLADFAARRGTTPQPAPEIHRTARVQPHRPQQHPTATALDKPAPTADGEAAKHWSLRQVFGKWKNFERRSADATRANELALIDFETWLGNSTLPIHDITRPMGVDFKSWLVCAAP